jgi:hypothetical protein
VRGKKNLARLVSGFVFSLAKPEFYSHLVSWRVVIRTPVLMWKHYCTCFCTGRMVADQLWVDDEDCVGVGVSVCEGVELC